MTHSAKTQTIRPPCHEVLTDCHLEKKMFLLLICVTRKPSFSKNEMSFSTRAFSNFASQQIPWTPGRIPSAPKIASSSWPSISTFRCVGGGSRSEFDASSIRTPLSPKSSPDWMTLAWLSRGPAPKACLADPKWTEESCIREGDVCSAIANGKTMTRSSMSLRLMLWTSNMRLCGIGSMATTLIPRFAAKIVYWPTFAPTSQRTADSGFEIASTH
jgi:hypothetical protein